MSTQSAAVALPVRPMEVVVKGKLVATRRHEQRVYSQIVTPASDEYSQPQTVEIRSRSKIGERDELVQVRCRLGGFLGRAFQATDKETGEIRTARNVVVTLDLVE